MLDWTETGTCGVNMNLVVIHTGHNATVAIFEEGECRGVFQEEKFNNAKNYTGFPSLALSFAINIIGRVDAFVFCETQQFFINAPDSAQATNIYEKATHYSIKGMYRYLEYRTGWMWLFSSLRDYVVRNKVAPGARQLLESHLKKLSGAGNIRIEYVDHHTAHCLSPLTFYGMNKVVEKQLLMSLDGAGDSFCSKVFVYDPSDQSLQQIAATPQDASLGLVYARMTKFLGMKMNEHEYKVMGLAAYVSERKYYAHIVEKLKQIVWLDEESLTFRSKFNTNTIFYFFQENFVGERFDNLSAGLQAFLEELVLQWIRAAIRKTGIPRVMLGGGVFMNVKLNQKILALPEVEALGIQPSCGDESLVIGAAGEVLRREGQCAKPVCSMYLGHEYSSEEVKYFLEKHGYQNKYKVVRVADIECRIAELLANHHVVARVRGKGEWGARSLCNRGILGNASDLKAFFEVNDMIKMRDFWMPFAPTILEEYAERYLVDWKELSKKCLESSRYMILTFQATELATLHLRAAMHQKDKTLRPQVVATNTDDRLYLLLKHYERLTGMGGVMNTSLNLHGFPLVGTLEQAMYTFENSGLKYLALEDYLVEKA